MFGFFDGKNRKSSCLLGDDQRLFTFKLKEVDEPLNPMPLWDYRHGGGNHHIEVESEKPMGLMEVLNAHRCRQMERDRRGFLTETFKVFTDVVMWVSPAIWEQEIQFGGPRLELLADNLSKLHHEDFGDELAWERDPSYVIMPGAGLDKEEVVFQFGLGVFVPGENDRLTARLTMKRKDKTPWHGPADWIFWKNGRRRFMKSNNSCCWGLRVISLRYKRRKPMMGTTFGSNIAKDIFGSISDLKKERNVLATLLTFATVNPWEDTNRTCQRKSFFEMLSKQLRKTDRPRNC